MINRVTFLAVKSEAEATHLIKSNEEDVYGGYAPTQEPKEQMSAGRAMLEMMRYPNMKRKFCILTFLWLANSVAYNGLSYNSSNLGVFDTLAFFINAIVEAPAYVLTWWAMGRYGRKWTHASTMLLGGVACCCCMFVPEGRLHSNLITCLTSSINSSLIFT